MDHRSIFRVVQMLLVSALSVGCGGTEPQGPPGGTWSQPEQVGTLSSVALSPTSPLMKVLVDSSGGSTVLWLQTDEIQLETLCSLWWSHAAPDGAFSSPSVLARDLSSFDARLSPQGEIDA